MEFDLVVKNATIVTAAEILPQGLSIGVKAGKIVCIATELTVSSSTKVLDAEGAYVTPGGIDSHVHLAQDNSPTGDTWLTGSRSAVAGGNTTIIAFATQKRSDESLFPVVEEYHRRSRGQSYVDYGFHLILTRPDEKILRDELPIMVDREGITSVKLYMTYPAMRLGDGDLLEVMLKTRELGMTTMIHAENAEMIDLITKRLIANKRTLPFNHAIARPQIAESEATHRAIALSTLTSTPILLVHLSSAQALDHRLVHIISTFLAHKLPQQPILARILILPTPIPVFPGVPKPDKEGEDEDEKGENDEWAGARHVCAPPLRHAESDLQGVWDAITRGTVNVISSDHAPSKYDHRLGKRKPVFESASSTSSTAASPPTKQLPLFKDIPNGLPGIETRLPLLFSSCTTSPSSSSSSSPLRTLTLPHFVSLTSTTPARIYGLSHCKGSILPGLDADLCIWYPTHDPRGHVTISNYMLHHDIDYTPFEGVKVANWPRWTVLRGKVVWDRDLELGEQKDQKTEMGKRGGILGRPGDGVFVKRKRGEVVVGRVDGAGREGEAELRMGMLQGERSAWM